LAGISLEIHVGERIALIGRNGCGKSTLMLHANGIKKPQKGEVRVDGKIVRYIKKDLLELRRQVGLVFQNPEDQLFSASVFQDLSMGPLNMGLTAEQARLRVQKVAELCDLTDLMNRPTHALSGGEKTKAALAGVLAMEPQILFADEVTNSLDPWIRLQVLDILSSWVDHGHTVVLSTHDWNLASTWAQRIIWMDKGRVSRQGTPAEVLKGQDLPEGMHNHDQPTQ
ncbi:MAG TPA: ABC transporter ATP-binding protein, partial [Longilinea sp.]|nr:ABC transporter ATP-binding protein [Longilinea sp.]